MEKTFNKNQIMKNDNFLLNSIECCFFKLNTALDFKNNNNNKKKLNAYFHEQKRFLLPFSVNISKSWNFKSKGTQILIKSLKQNTFLLISTQTVT